MNIKLRSSFHSFLAVLILAAAIGSLSAQQGGGGGGGGGSGGSGTVTSVSVTTANGVSGTVATATTTPAISITLGAITPSSVNSSGEVTTPASTTANAGLTLPQGTAPSAPVNGDLWTTTSGLFVRIAGGTVGPLSAGGGTLAYPVTITGGVSGAIPCFTATTTESAGTLLTANSPVLGGGAGVCPSTVAGITSNGVSQLSLGVAGSSVGGVQLFNATSGSVTINPATGALGTVTATLPANTGTIGELNLAQTWTATQTFVGPALGTPTSGVLTNATGYKFSSLAANSAAITLAQGNFPSIINCAQTTASQACWTHGETTAATQTGDVNLQATTLTTSTAIDLQLTQGAAGPAATNAPALINITAAAAGGAASASINGLTGAPITLITGAGSAGGATTGNGGSGGAFSVTLGAGGAHGGTTTNTGGVGGAFALTPGAGTQGAATGAGGAAGTTTVSAAVGGAGGSTSGAGGAGSDFLVTTGTGGAATSGSTTGRGGNAVFTLGSAGGTGTAGAPGQFEIVGGSVLAGNTTPFLNITGTWNTTGVVDAAIFANITNTGSGAASKLIDLQIGSVSQFNVDKAGNVIALGTHAFGPTPPTCTFGTGGGLCFSEGTGITAAANVDDMYADSTYHDWAVLVNGGVKKLVASSIGYNSGSISASVGATNIASSANFPTGEYVLSCDVVVTAVGSSPTLAVTVGWTDISGTARTKTCVTSTVGLSDNPVTQAITSNGSAAITVTQTLAVSTATWQTTAAITRVQ